MDNTTSDTDGSLEVRARQNVVLCILGLLFNSTVLAVVAVSVRLRKSAKYQLIVSLSLADVLAGLIYLPLDTVMALEGGRWKYGCGLLLFTYGLHEFVMPTIASLTLSALCIEYSLTMFYNVTTVMRRRVVKLGVMLPWVLGLASLLPVYLLRFVTSSGHFTPPAECVKEEWSMSTLTLLVGMYGYLPLTFLLACLLLMVVAYCCRPPDDRIAVRTIISRSEGVYLTHEFADTFFAALLSLGFNLPFLMELVLLVTCRDSWCHSSQRVRHGLDVLRTTESVFFPAVWMLGMEFRHGLFTSCNCCYKYCDMEVEQAFT